MGTGLGAHGTSTSQKAAMKRQSATVDGCHLAKALEEGDLVLWYKPKRA
jgi:hypothetical protein